MLMPYRALVEMIRGVGKRPVERDALYHPIRTEFAEAA